IDIWRQMGAILVDCKNGWVFDECLSTKTNVTTKWPVQCLSRCGTINARGFFQNNALGPLESCLCLTLLRHIYKYNSLPIDSRSLNHSIVPLL
ncbi:hypothetical protein JI435_413010, partial [Parastagonospora nodorum SN15]